MGYVSSQFYIIFHFWVDNLKLLLKDDKNKHCKIILKVLSLVVEYLENLNFMCLMQIYDIWNSQILIWEYLRVPLCFLFKF